MNKDTQSWSNSNLTEMEELLQKTQQLQRENDALRKDVYQCPPTSENSYEGLKWSDAFDLIEGDNANLHNEVTALKRENLSLREARKPVAVPGLHGLVTWYADAQQLGEAFQREREKAERYRLVTLRQDADNTALRNKLAALENQTQWECSCGGTDCEGQKENAALREDKEILDWMNGNIEAIMFKYKPDGFVWDFRDIIRGAMAKEDKP